LDTFNRVARLALLVSALALTVMTSTVATASNGMKCLGSVIKTVDASGTKWSLVCGSPCDQQKGCEQWDSFSGKACRCPGVVQINCCDVVLDETAQGEAQVVANGYCETVMGACPMGAGDCTWDKLVTYQDDKIVTYYVGLCKEA
jgi:hypothetical protein